MSPDAPFPVTVHPYQSPNRGACAYELGRTGAQNAVVFIGGLGDGPHTVPFVRTVARHLEDIGKHLDYSIFEIRMRSSFTGFGTGSLKKDVEDIAALVKYLRGLGKKKIVLFGHSTGCQDCMEYADYDKHHNPPVDGFILQAPVSDREGFALLQPNIQESVDLAEDWIAHGKAMDCLPKDKVPRELGAPVTAYRLKSLLAIGGDDDYFSSDLDDETVAQYWGRFSRPVLVLHSEKDEFVPESISQSALNKRYQGLSSMVTPLSGLIPDAGHNVLQDGSRKWLGERVVDFLQTLTA